MDEELMTLVWNAYWDEGNTKTALERVAQVERLAAEAAEREKAEQIERDRIAEENRKAELAKAAELAREQADRDAQERIAAAERAAKEAEERAAQAVIQEREKAEREAAAARQRIPLELTLRRQPLKNSTPPLLRTACRRSYPPPRHRRQAAQPWRRETCNEH